MVFASLCRCSLRFAHGLGSEEVRVKVGSSKSLFGLGDLRFVRGLVLWFPGIPLCLRDFSGDLYLDGGFDSKSVFQGYDPFR